MIALRERIRRSPIYLSSPDAIRGDPVASSGVLLTDTRRGEDHPSHMPICEDHLGTVLPCEIPARGFIGGRNVEGRCRGSRPVRSVDGAVHVVNERRRMRDYIGVDWADTEHAVWVEDEAGTKVMSRSVPQTVAGLSERMPGRLIN